MLLTWIKGSLDAFSETMYHEYLMSNWEKNICPSISTNEPFRQFWFTVLHDGVAYVKENVDKIPSFSASAFTDVSNRMQSGSDYVVILQDNHSVGDGRFANNGWLQELPHPVTRTVWDNYAAVSVQAASDLGVNTNDMLEVSVDGRSVNLPVFIQPRTCG